MLFQNSSHQLAAAADTELREKLLDHGLDGAFGNSQLSRNFFIRQPFEDAAQDGALSCGDLFLPDRIFGRWLRFHESLQISRRKPRAARHNLSYTVRQ